MSIEIIVWDLPLRIFHWLLVLGVTALIVTGKIGGGWMDWHGRIGIFIAGLLVFRVIWGFVGSTHARFSSFIPTWKRVVAYIKGQWRGHGHNPLGAFSVIALLAVLTALVATGIFANDDIAYQGPLFDLVDKSFSDTLSGWHARIFNMLALLIGFHVVAIVFYVRVKKNNIVIPMVTGKKVVPREQAVHVSGYGALRFGVLRFAVTLVISGVVAWGIGSGAVVHRLHPAPAVPVATTPNW